MSEVNMMETLLGDGEDNALIRFTMGSAFIKHGKFEQAIEQLEKAIELEPGFTAAWLKYAEALYGNGRITESLSTLSERIRVATEKGDSDSIEKISALREHLQKST
jgi:predicted Zn-dependent protease